METQNYICNFISLTDKITIFSAFFYAIKRGILLKNVKYESFETILFQGLESPVKI